MSPSSILVTSAGGIRTITLNRPERLNAIDPELADLIVDKNRGGPTGTAAALFFPTYTLFADAEDADHTRAAMADP